jgi:uncharacterized protein
VPGIFEVPLETFFSAVDHMIGTLKGAEAALLTAVHDRRVKAVSAISPSHVVWRNVGPGRDGVAWPERSSWTLNGTALPFVAPDPYWRREARNGQSLTEAFSNRACVGSPLKRKRRPILSSKLTLTSSLWQAATMRSGASARAIVARRAEASKATSLVLNPDAGHRILLPGETKARSSLHARGSNDEAEAALGQAAWREIAQRSGEQHPSKVDH